MARTVRDTNLETRSARLRLTPRRKPYWRVLETGLHIGYRRTKEGGGSWIARRFVGDGRYNETKVGTADDLQDPDGVVLHSFAQAQEAARAWWRAEARKELGHAPDHGPYTVGRTLDAYFADRERRGSKGVAKDKAAANLRIRPELGEIEFSKLTAKRIRDWHTGLATAPKLTRAARTKKKRKSQAINPKDSDAVRARRSTANRTLTVLKAALNHAFHEGRVASDDAWRKAKPFREVDAAVVRFLSEDECRRLVNACNGPFRDLVRAALLTGCRYGELTRMRAIDFNAEAGTITVRESKAGKPRHVALTDEGRALFATLTAGKVGREPVFVRYDGAPWGASHQQRPLADASNRAKVSPAATFHILRHTYASSLAMKGVPMGVIAAQLGHADTRMTEKHYAHLAPNYVAETVRAALPTLGIVDKSNVASILNRAKA
ncbi:MAG: site-specific integrase [Methylocystis sp.]|uniref:tyrosine-type recombinase/integrase n=1 Tax=Methylocystis sp. TaxID=1911079 RepID=UPI0039626AF4